MRLDLLLLISDRLATLKTDYAIVLYYTSVEALDAILTILCGTALHFIDLSVAQFSLSTPTLCPKCNSLHSIVLPNYRLIVNTHRTAANMFASTLEIRLPRQNRLQQIK